MAAQLVSDSARPAIAGARRWRRTKRGPFAAAASGAHADHWPSIFGTDSVRDRRAAKAHLLPFLENSPGGSEAAGDHRGKRWSGRPQGRGSALRIWADGGPAPRMVGPNCGRYCTRLGAGLLGALRARRALRPFAIGLRAPATGMITIRQRHPWPLAIFGPSGYGLRTVLPVRAGPPVGGSRAHSCSVCCSIGSAFLAVLLTVCLNPVRFSPRSGCCGQRPLGGDGGLPGRASD